MHTRDVSSLMFARDLTTTRDSGVIGMGGATEAGSPLLKALSFWSLGGYLALRRGLQLRRPQFSRADQRVSKPFGARSWCFSWR